MNYKSIFLIMCVIGLVVVSGCAAQSSNGVLESVGRTNHMVTEWYDVSGSGTDMYAIYKVTIPEDNVTCYVMDNYYGGGISCFRDVAIE